MSTGINLKKSASIQPRTSPPKLVYIIAQYIPYLEPRQVLTHPNMFHGSLCGMHFMPPFARETTRSLAVSLLGGELKE